MNWVKVSEAMPDVGVPVLCVGCDDDGEFLAPIVATMQDNGKFICGYRFHGGREIGFYMETNVVKWMPLPPI